MVSDEPGCYLKARLDRCTTERVMLLSGDLSQTCITSARLRLRAFTATDAADSFAESNARVAKFMSWSPSASESEYSAIWQKFLTDMKMGRELFPVIRLTSTNDIIGIAGLHPADGELLETGVWVKESAQRRGYGREAVTALIGWASAVFHPSGFLWPVVDENIPSRRLAESLGGEVIGTQQRQKAGDISRTMLLYRLPARP